MGHLINPSGMRVGWFSYWEDIWFIDFIYYPEFLHSILKIRWFLVYFFGLRFVELCGLIYSHFVILKNFKFIIVRVFFLNGAVDEMISDFFKDCGNFLIEHEQLLLDLSRRNYIFKFNFNRVFKLIMIIRVVSFFLYRRLVKLNLAAFVYLIKNLKYKALRSKVLFKGKNGLKLITLFNDSINLNLQYSYYDFLLSEKVRFLFLVFLSMKMLINIRLSLKNSFQYTAEYTFIKVLFVGISLRSIFFWVGKFLSMFISKIILFCDFGLKFNFYMLKNEQVCAKFLSRYIARKLQQGFHLKSLVNPIKKDLKRVASVLNPYRIGNNRYFYEKNHSYFWLNNLFLKGLFVRLLSVIISVYRIEFCKFYNYNHCWLNFDSWILLYWMLQNFVNSEELIGLSFFYFCYKGGFVLFFNIDNLFMYNFLKINYIEFGFFLKKIKNFQLCFERIYFSLYAFNISFFSYLNLVVNEGLLLKVSIFFFNNVLKYNFWIKNYISRYNWYINYNRYNKVLFIPELFGFKFKFSGRFSRKQRASSIVYSIGKMPLTKLSANIDYGFYTIPLKNSEISVKIWLYRTWSIKEIDPLYGCSLE